MPIQLIATERILEAVDDVLNLENVSKELHNELKIWRDGNKANEYGIENVASDGKCSGTILFKTVKRVFDELRKDDRQIYLSELLEGSGIYFEPVKEPQKSPELLARLEKLQAKQDQLRYRSMVKNVDSELVSKTPKEIAFEVRSTSRQLSSVVNFVLSIGGTFLFGFVSSQYAFANIGMRVIFGVLLASIVALAELYFMARTEI